MGRALAVLSFMVILSSCGSPSSTTVTPAPVATVTLSSTSASLAVGNTTQFSATTKDANGTVLSGRTITWNSTAPAVASVSNTGLVTALAAGTTTVSATSEGEVGSATITVTAAIAPVATVTLSQSAATIVPASTLQLSAITKDAAGTVLTGRTIIWSTSASTVATVSANGLVSAAAVGSATITATSEGKNATATITVASGAIVGAAGGTVNSPDGNATVVIPAGALSQPTPISITPSTTTPLDALGIAGTNYDFQPTGTQFAVPVTLSIKYNPAHLIPGIPAGTMHIAVASGGQWTGIDSSTADTVAHIARATVSHFSEYSGDLYDFWFDITDLSPSDPFALIPVAFTKDISMCEGEFWTVTVTGVGSATAPSGTPTIDKTVATYLLTNNFTYTIDGVKAGKTTLVALYGRAHAIVNVVINTCVDGVPIAATGHTSTAGGTDDVYGSAGHGTPQAVTTNHKSRYGTIGSYRTPVSQSLRLPGGANLASTTPPMAYLSTSGPNPLEVVYWNGTGGAATSIAMPSPTAPSGFGSFDPAGNYLFLAPTGLVVDVWAVPFGSTTAVRLTNLNGSATSIAVGGDGMMYFDWRPSAGQGHIYRMPMPTIGSTPPTSGQVQVTSSALIETQPAISQNGRLLAYIQQDAGLTKFQLFVQSVFTAGATPIAVTPTGSFAFSPSWCGNEFLYFTLSTGSLSGPYQVMRWSPATGITTVVASYTGLNVFDFAVARTDGDRGLHVCP